VLLHKVGSLNLCKIWLNKVELSKCYSNWPVLQSSEIRYRSRHHTTGDTKSLSKICFPTSTVAPSKFFVVEARFSNSESSAVCCPLIKALHCSQGFFVTVRAGTAYREMKMTKAYFVCQYCISMIN